MIITGMQMCDDKFAVYDGTAECDFIPDCIDGTDENACSKNSIHVVLISAAPSHITSPFC